MIFTQRRGLCMGILGFGVSTLFGNVSKPKREEIEQEFELKMVGDLDDDLMVIQASNTFWEMKDCFQMHNPTNRFTLNGKTSPSVHIPGWIDHTKSYKLKDNEVLMAVLANEREERDSTQGLINRTHYKSCELTINGEVLIPRMDPDYKDIDNYPSWFGAEDELSSYNYYRAWENAVVNIGLIFPKEGEYRILLANDDGQFVVNDLFQVTKETSNIRFHKTIFGKLDEHPMSEMDGGVFLAYMKEHPDDEVVRKLSARYIFIQSEDVGTVAMPLPYPFPYPNRIFCKAI